jgi:L-ascorbate metabolism protein UlaG (beta-lactamase superfamily)
MVITYHGTQFFKIQQGDTMIAINPPAKTNRFGTNIGIVSLNDPDFNGTDNLSYGDRKPLIISGPGEYEVGGIFVQGFGVPVVYKEQQKINTVYYITIEKMRLCFLGALGKPVLSEEMEEQMTEVDILFVPIGGGDVLSPADAYKIARSLEASIVIPTHYEKDTDPIVKKFLEEASEKEVKPIEKLTLRKKDVEEKEGEVVILKQS